jgi:hypothetical protein
MVILHDSVTSRRAMGSFFWMLENIDATYYMFCDHDDIWLPQKVELSLAKIREIERDNRPALVCCDLVVTDSNLNTISPSLWSYMKLRPELLTKLKYAISCNLFTGCTMIINRAARDISLPISPRAVMHDSWIGLRVLTAGGDVAWIPTPLILYRQHTDNLFGAHRVSRSRSYYLHKLRTIKGVIATYRQNFLMAKDALGGRATLFVGTSGTDIEHKIAFDEGVLGCNGIYNSFSLGPKVQYDTMPFGFQNHLIFASINFRQAHMEKAIDVLVDSRYDEVVELIEKDEFIKNPLDAYENKIFCKGAPLKTGVIWNKDFIKEDE